MNNQYLIRLDDACPTMNGAKWKRALDILDRYQICPMIGIIPHNEDEKQMIDAPDSTFWDKARMWEEKGYAIAMHGYNHCYISDKGLQGLNPLWSRSEFAGVDYDVQCQKIKEGYALLKEQGLHPRFFFAPSHTFDYHTLKALKEYTDIRMISDTIATKPYKDMEFVFIPQMGGHCIEMKIPGIWTFCLHPNEMTDNNFSTLETFLQKHQQEFCSFDKLNLQDVGKKNLLGRLLSFIYFAKRRMKGAR